MSLEGEEETFLDEDMPETNEIKKNLLNELDSPVKAANSSDSAESHLIGQDHMKVYLRIRPLNDEEIQLGEGQNCMDVVNGNTMSANAPKESHAFKNSTHGLTKQHHKFTFSHIFNEKTTQKEFFDETMLTTVKEFVDGQNCLVFTYGVTNSGKTYTIQGHPMDGGILPRALDVVFNSISERQLQEPIFKPKMFCDVQKLTPGDQEREKTIKANVLKLASSEEPEVSQLVCDGDISQMTVNSTMSEDSLMVQRQSIASTMSNPDISSLDSIEEMFKEADERVREEAAIDVENQGQIRFSIWVSFVEVYNEYAYDLLEPLPKKKNARRAVLQLREDKNGIPYCRGLKEVNVNNADEAYKILTVGKKNLNIACTKLNHNSSRSHCIFTMKMIRVVDTDQPHYARMSMLSFCDLAGSERYTKTQSNGERIKEAGNINTSLLTLGRCIKTLRHNQMNKNNQRIVPFRDSKLTRLFQSFFCGKGRALMIVNVNQCASTFDETLHALKYSAIAKQVVVTQVEPEKPKESKKVINNRYVSMMLSQTPGRSNRQTIGWATPGTYAKLMQEEDTAALVPLPEEDGDELNDLSVVTDQQQELVECVKALKEELIGERRKLLQLESQIRNEVCQEMAQQLVEIENAYTERLKAETALAEEKAEKKIEIYTQSVKKCRKRKRMFEEEEEDMVPGVLLHAEEVKTQEKQKEVDDLNEKLRAIESELDQLKSAYEDSCKDNDSLAQKNIDVNVRVADLEKQVKEMPDLKTNSSEKANTIEDLTIQCEDLENKLQDKDRHIEVLLKELENFKDMSTREEHTNQIGEFISKLADSEQEADSAREQVTKFQQLIDMLQCDISDKEDRISELQKSNSTLEKKLTSVNDEDTAKPDEFEELKSAVNEAEKKHQDLLAEVSTLTEYKKKCDEISSQLDEAEHTLKKQSEQLKEQEISIESLTVANDNLKTKAEEHDSKLEEKTALVGEKDQVIESQCCEIDKLKASLENADKETHDIKEQLIVKEQTSEEELKQTSSITDQLSRMGKELEEARVKNSEFEKMVSEMTDELAVHAALKEELRSLQEKIESLHEELSQHQGESEDAITNKNQEIQSLTSLNKELSTNIETLKQNSETEKSKIELVSKQTVNDTKEMTNLKKDVDMFKKLVKDKDTQITALEESLKSANEYVRKKVIEIGNLDKSKKDLDFTTASSNKQLTSLKSSNADLQNQLDDYILRVNEQAEEIGVLKEKCTTLNAGNEGALIAAEKVKQMESEGKKLQALITELEETLERERKQHKGAGADINELLQNKPTVAQQLETELKERETKIEKLSAECEKLSDQQEEVKRLKGKVADCLKEIDQLQESRSATEVKTSELKTKVSELQASIKNVEAEHEKELEEVRTELSEKQQELSKQTLSVKALEEDITRLKNEQGKTDEDKSEADSLRQQLRESQQKLEDADYKHQMSCRQVRREKSQLEKLLKETEEAAAEHESKVDELEKNVEDMTANKQTANEEAEKELAETKQKLSNIEEAMRELERCLQLSKDNEEKILQNLETYKQKNRKLEDSVAIKEESEQSLKENIEQIERLQSASDESNSAEVTELRSQLKELRTSLDDARAELESLREVKRETEAKLDTSIAAGSTMKEEILQLMDKLEQATIRADKLQGKIQSVISGNDSKSEELELKQTELQDERGKITHLTNDITALHDDITNKESRIKNLKEEKERMEVKLGNAEEQIDQLQHDLKEMTCKHEESSSNLSQQTEECSKLTTRVQELQTVSEENIQLKDTVNAMEKSVSEMETLRKTIAEYESERSDSKKRIIDLEESDREAKRIKVEVERLQTSSSENYKLKDELSFLKEQVSNISKLQAEIKELKDRITATEKEKSRVEDDLSKSRSQIISFETRIDFQKKEINELIDQGSKGTDRETILRSQLKDSSRQLEDQNLKFCRLESKLRELENQKDRHESDAKDSSQTVKDLKTEINALENEIREHKDEISSIKRERKSDEKTIEELKAEIEKKDQKLKSRSQTITEMISQRELERNTYDLAMKDHRANERMIEHMKEAMEEQEKTMETQDKVLQNRESEIKTFSKELEETLDKYQDLLSKKDTSASQVHRLEQAKEDAEKRCLDVQQQLTQTKRELSLSEKEKLRAESDMKETNKELQHLEKQIHEKTAIIEKLSNEMESNRKELNESRLREKENTQRDGQVKLLKSKFQALEDGKKQLENELTAMKDKVATMEQKKEQELKKWREERDKLVSGLEGILKQKDAEISVLKQAGKNVDMASVLATLREQLDEKDSLIDDLSRSLDQPRSRSTRQTRHKSGTSSTSSDKDKEEDEQLKKELNNLQSMLEQERLSHMSQVSKITKAKDEIISDMREQNVKLTKRLSDDETFAGSTSKSPEEEPKQRTESESSTTSQSTRQRRKTRTKKRKSTDMETSEVAETERKSTKRRSTRTNTKRNPKLKLDENEDPSMHVIHEEDTIDLDETTPRKPVSSRVLNNSTNTALDETPGSSTSTPSCDRLAMFVSPQNSPSVPPKRTHRKKRGLAKQATEPLQVTPTAESASEPAAPDAHVIVKRQLRSRRK